MKYDDASWHYGGEFPLTLAPSAASTHIGMFVAWATLNGFGSGIHTDEELLALTTRTITPGNWFISACDEKFTDEDLTVEGNEFAAHYYEAPYTYFTDYGNTFSSDIMYKVPDTWDTYDKLAPVIKRRFSIWRRTKTIKHIVSLAWIKKPS